MNPTLRRAERQAGCSPDVLRALGPFVDRRVLEPVDVHVTATLSARFGETDPDVLLAAALAVRAPRHGHVCVDLLGLDATALLSDDPDGSDDAPPALPHDRAGWLARVADSPLTRHTDEGCTPLVLYGSRLYTDRLHGHEARLAHALLARFAETRPVADPTLLRRGLEALFPAPAVRDRIDRQRLAAAMALLRGAIVISGGPGTGKTWTVRNLLTLLFAQSVAAGEPWPRVALAAPTGKAAARMAESVRAGLEAHAERAGPALGGATPDDLMRFLTSLTPSTLHRLLGWQPHDPTRFRHNADRPLPYDVLVVDEASMVDLVLMSRLVDAVPTHARLVLLGDRHQLASVEAGSVLGDVCGEADGGRIRLSGEAAHALGQLAGIDVPPTMEAPGPWDAVVFLTESRRFDAEGGIGRFAAAAIAGDVAGARAAAETPRGPIEPVTSTGPLDGAEVLKLPHDGRGLPEAARRLVVRAWRPYLEALRADPRDPARHVEALERFGEFRILCAHRRGPFGVSNIGHTAVELLRAEGLIDPSEGSWWLGRPVLVTRNDPAVRRFNGDIGLVVHDPRGQPVVAFLEDSGKVSWLPPSRMPECETVYAMTIHKSQGSEFATVLVVLPDRPSPVLTRELVYTGVTRARRRVVLVSSDEVLEQGILRRVERATGLGSRLWSEAP